MSGERNAEIARRFAAGENIGTLATEYGVSRQRISQIAHRAGVTPRQEAMHFNTHAALTAFGRFLRTQRLRLGWSQNDLAAAMGVHQSVISSYETGEREPRLCSAIALADALGVTLNEIARATDPTNNDSEK